MRAWKVERLAFEIDTEPYAKARDAQIGELAAKSGVQLMTRWGHTLCDLDELLARHPGGRYVRARVPMQYRCRGSLL